MCGCALPGGPAATVTNGVKGGEPNPGEQSCGEQPPAGLVLRLDPAATHTIVLRHGDKHITEETLMSTP